MWCTLPDKDGMWQIFRILGNKREYLLGSYGSREAAQKMCNSLNRRGKDEGPMFGYKA